MKHYSSYQFCLDYFQNIMDLEWDELWENSPRKRAKHILDLCEQYRKMFSMDRSYKSSEVWNIIKRKHTKWFDDLLSETIEK